ncbi:MAG: hypothetical protein J6T96_10660 [Bacteroidales bacterium]|nr:hypothetical protein [Bacteroidales bacterium]
MELQKMFDFFSERSRHFLTPFPHAHGLELSPLWGLVCLPRSANGAKSPNRVRERTEKMQKIYFSPLIIICIFAIQKNNKLIYNGKNIITW